MIYHLQISDRELRIKMREGVICYGGHQRFKIYGTMRCSSGKRMKRENRVLFTGREQAADKGFRPCGHCLPAAYQKWKDGFI